jgi:hypothetical protein
MANVVENGATTKAERDIDAKAEPVVAEVPVHVDEGPLGQHCRLRKEARLLPFHLHYLSSLNLDKSGTHAIVEVGKIPCSNTKFQNMMGSGLLTVMRMSAICRVTFSMCMEDLYAVASESMAWAVVIFFPS